MSSGETRRLMKMIGEMNTMTKFIRKESSVMYICTYCYYADNICECDDQIESKEHTFLKITTTSKLVNRNAVIKERFKK